MNSSLFLETPPSSLLHVHSDKKKKNYKFIGRSCQNQNEFEEKYAKNFSQSVVQYMVKEKDEKDKQINGNHVLHNIMEAVEYCHLKIISSSDYNEYGDKTEHFTKDEELPFLMIVPVNSSDAETAKEEKKECDETNIIDKLQKQNEISTKDETIDRLQKLYERELNFHVKSNSTDSPQFHESPQFEFFIISSGAISTEKMAAFLGSSVIIKDKKDNQFAAIATLNTFKTLKNECKWNGNHG